MFENSNIFPGWLVALLTEEFFTACVAHEDVRKNEKNIFCLDCCEAICNHCVIPHHPHRLFQVRRYIYKDVLKLKDAKKLLDCDSVQTYISNSEKVVFLKQRPLTRTNRGSAKMCTICDRAVHVPFLFCSISCKIEHMMKTGVKLSDHICNWESLVLPEPGFGDDQMTPETVLEPADSASSGCAAAEETGCRTIAATATTEIVKKKKKRSTLASSRRSPCRRNSGPVPKGAVAVNYRRNHRRKGTPHRAPLF